MLGLGLVSNYRLPYTIPYLLSVAHYLKGFIGIIRPITSPSIFVIQIHVYQST